MNIQVRSRTLAKEFLSDTAWAAISVSTEMGDFPDLQVQNRVGLLRLQFWDISTPSQQMIEAEDPKLFSKENARSILDFVDAHYIDTLLVHCEAGKSRSPAIAAAVAHIKLGEGAEKVWFDNYNLNRFVYNVILAEHYGMSAAEMAAQAFMNHKTKPEEILDEAWEV
jgi:hypothetical protein